MDLPNGAAGPIHDPSTEQPGHGAGQRAAAYRLRWRRRRLLWRAWRRRREIAPHRDRTAAIGPRDILAFAVIRNEAARLPFFLEHYRGLGVAHFLVVDNGSDDGSLGLLSAAPDVSVWRSVGSYRAARFGLDWLTVLLARYGHGHWCLTVDADELLVYPHWRTRDLGALTGWLATCGRESSGGLMLDLYRRGPLDTAGCAAGHDPLGVLDHFDAGNYLIGPRDRAGARRVQGGVRARAFFADTPDRAPTLQKIPLVRWNRRYAYLNSTHAALPPRLNAVAAEDGGEITSGVLLHTKFLDIAIGKAIEDLDRRQHFARPDDYGDYYCRLIADLDLSCDRSTVYRGWRHLEALGLMSRGGWV